MNPAQYNGAPGPGAIYTQEFTEVLAISEWQLKLPGGVLLAQGNGIVKKGTVLGKVTASSKFIPYDSDATDGSQVAVCILDNDQDTTLTDIGASAWIGAVFTESKLTGLDAAAKTALKLCYFV
ncbi:MULTISPECIES: head decoration protein [unclassified Paenibacillus]|uniref:head decoration protein n=1 Tax=unclassified Paenibacillus TaxID=185978 RepID=UPI00096DB329|nr:hypothetical protein BJP48_30130 [Paenibacillus odorifer]